MSKCYLWKYEVFMKGIKIGNKEYIVDATQKTYKSLSLKEKKKYRSALKEKLSNNFQSKLKESIERYFKIQDLSIIQKLPFCDLACEAKELYVGGYFYSTIAICGVIAESIARAVLDDCEVIINQRNRIRGKTIFKKLDFVVINKILINANLIHQDSYKKLEKIRKLRNKYIHNYKVISPLTVKKDALVSLNYIVSILKIEFKP